MTREVNCMNCMIGRFKDDLCDEKMCEALKSIGDSDDFVDIIMLAKELVRCKDCRHQEHCHETVAHTKDHGGFREHWSEPIEWCSRGERREP